LGSTEAQLALSSQIAWGDLSFQVAAWLAPSQTRC